MHRNPEVVVFVVGCQDDFELAAAGVGADEVGAVAIGEERQASIAERAARSSRLEIRR
ncbi:MAG TPA: hypothetical protein VKG83_17030 [Mycobacterium sp.]|nr:hypothetical protein [Mycobacterium sp.]